MAYEGPHPLPLSSGGTNTTSLSNTNGTAYFDGTKLNTVAAGTSGFILTSNGTGSPPSYQANGSISTIDGDTGSVSGSTISVLAATSGSSVEFSPTSSTALNLTVTDSNQNTIIGSGAGNGTISGNGNVGLGQNALHSLTSGIYNCAIGNALGSLTIGEYNVGIVNGSLGLCTAGSNNIAIGYDALGACTSGSTNIAIGFGAASALTTPSFNIGIGYNSLASTTTGSQNVTMGYHSMLANTTGSSNTGIGLSALAGNTSGGFNCAFGIDSISTNTTGSQNCAFGANTLKAAGFSGNDNTILGTSSGSNYSGTESSNILIGFNVGGTTGESSVTRIANIRGKTTTQAAIACLVDTTGQLGTTSSSLRYKMNISDMGDDSSAILKMRPIKFNYKTHPDDPLQYGLIAEEVNEVMPQIVVRDLDGEIESVQYHILPALLLNELKKLDQKVRELQQVVHQRGV
jgi:hypothetical protein